MEFLLPLIKEERIRYMPILEEIKKRTVEFQRHCRAHQVLRMYIFGSSVTQKFSRQSSDVDLFVIVDEPDPFKRGELLLSLWDVLEGFFQRRVDLLTDDSLRNPYLKKEIDKTKVLIYDRAEREISV